MERRGSTKNGGGRRSSEAWRRIVDELDRSGATVAAFAAERGLNANTLSWWRSAIRRKDGRATPAAATAAPRFVELVPRAAAVPRAGTIEISTPSGLSVRASADVDPDSVSRVVAALLRSC
jgi:transposase-like protein